MFLRTWRFITIMLTVVAFATAFSHLLELRPKLAYEPALYVKLHRTLYVNYGRIGGPAETLALISAIGLAWRVRRRRRGAFPLTVAAAACLLAGMIGYLALVRPVNVAMAGWPLDAIPVDWTLWRDQWEYVHAVRALLILAALVTLVISSLRETPDDLVLAQPQPNPPGPGHRQVAVAAPNAPRVARRVIAHRGAARRPLRDR